MKSAELIEYGVTCLHIPQLMLKLFIQSLGVEYARLIVHQAVEVPSLLILRVNRCSSLSILHNDLVVVLN